MPTWTVVPLASSRGFSVGDRLLPISSGCVASLLLFAGPSQNLNFLILSDKHGSNTALPSQLFWKEGKTNLPVNAGKCTDVTFLVLALMRSHKRI